MIASGGEPITAAQAVHFFKEYTVLVGYLDEIEVGEHTAYFAQAMKDEALNLAQDISHAKEGWREEIAAARREVAALKRRLLNAKSEGDRQSLLNEMADAELELQDCLAETVAAQQALAAFKADKRHFLVEYVNRQTQPT